MCCSHNALGLWALMWKKPFELRAFSCVNDGSRVIILLRYECTTFYRMEEKIQSRRSRSEMPLLPAIINEFWYVSGHFLLGSHFKGTPVPRATIRTVKLPKTKPGKWSRPKSVENPCCWNSWNSRANLKTILKTVKTAVCNGLYFLGEKKDSCFFNELSFSFFW